VAGAISEGPERSDGGLIGVVAEKDLSPEIFDAVFSLKGGEVSAITRTAQGFHLFWVDERFNEADSEENSRLLDDVRKTIQEQKTRLKVESYFTTELYKAHSVDRKI
jgi:parvulin-like peptidyl-prolyl isomerase